MKLAFRLVQIAIGAISLGSSLASAESIDFLKINGQARSYYFSRLNNAPGVPDANAFSAGGILNVETKPFLGGFGAGISFFTANSLGLNNDKPGHTDVTLMGNGSSLNALGQAFLQYKNSNFLIRAGDQVINTPWLGSSDSRLLPATYRGVYAEMAPLENLRLYGLRINKWKSRTSNEYYKDNLYYPVSYAGDSMYGAASALGAGAQQSSGVAAVGAAYTTPAITSQAWYYDFYRFARMAYGDATYTYKTGTGFDPFIGAQLIHEENNASLLNGTKVNTQVGSGVKATASGVKVGMNSPYGQFTVAYNEIVSHSGAVGGGALVSPYTVGYATDPLYTTSMIRGLVEQGPGNAIKIGYATSFLDKKVLLAAAYARYRTTYFGNSQDTYLDLTYLPKGRLKGLSVRDRVEVSNGGSGLNPGNKSFVYNRVMVQYSF
ncbi:hypothetical protein TPL01_25630 [Sulfuriferula plumbiphila]|uniref:Porin n=1 Tax=Sulfuriferula plumbiphila TaxID=171865 RepID=A0A512LAB2_9PROT|nr:OprD family outer membrane porin [Sulfuriferula plumbiphila]BBP03125.1 hypothetical protein SFPGR_05470 [Sulfuriferula plumbiphila]GEP31425.1 hypothetical protein TPL01_25630 [Sulfuriferula plumbiphila]